MAPRLTPRALPDNAAQDATNARLVSGDLEPWRQFLEVERLNQQPQTIYLLNGTWLSWLTDVDVARGIIPGDNTFRIYLTGPDEYDQPRWTNYSMAVQSPGGPYPVVTRPLGVPNPDSAPTLQIGVDSSPLSFSVNTLDSNAQLATDWTVNPPVVGARYYTVTQGAGYYLATYDENRDPGQEAYAYRNFGVAGVTAGQYSVDFYFDGDTSFMQAAMIVGASPLGAGVGVQYNLGTLSIRKTTEWGAQYFNATLVSEAVVPPLAAGIYYTMKVGVVVNADGSKTVTAEIFQGSGQLATLVSTASFDDGDYCGFADGVSADSSSQYKTRYANYLVQASGSTGYVPTNLATSYVFTFVNDVGEESGPSDPSTTITRPDGVTVTITTPTSAPLGVDYDIETKRIYRASTGNTGTVFRFVAEIPLSQADYVDVLTDAQLGELLETDLFALPPDDLRGILALPNGVMAGFRRNQLCLSARNHPHAWPVEYRLNTDTDIVGIANIDNTIVIGTESFPYLAGGNDPAAYSMSKLEVPQACTSKRSFAYLTNIGVVFASPDGLIAVAGTGQVKNLTETIFDRHQWQALDPTTIIGVAHDDVYHFWCGATPSDPILPAPGWNTTNEVGDWTFSNSDFTALATPTITGDALFLQVVELLQNGSLTDHSIYAHASTTHGSGVTESIVDGDFPSGHCIEVTGFHNVSGINMGSTVGPEWDWNTETICIEAYFKQAVGVSVIGAQILFADGIGFNGTVYNTNSFATGLDRQQNLRVNSVQAIGAPAPTGTVTEGIVQHIACQKIGGDITFYVDGVPFAATTSQFIQVPGGETPHIGYDAGSGGTNNFRFDMYRITVGPAPRYTGPFTPPTYPLSTS